MRIPRSKTAAAWIAIYATMLQALLWSRHIEALYLFIGPVTWAAALVLVLRARTTRLVRRIFSACLILLAFAIAAQFFTQWRIARLPRDWPQVLAAREENMDALLDRTVGRIVERGQQTAQIAAQRASESPRDTARLFARLAALRARSKVDAVAVFSEQGDLVAWAGEHRALVPEPVRFGIYDVTYIEQPLYSYIYFRAKVRGTRWHVISAVLLSEALHGEVAEAEHENGVARTVAEIGAAFHPKTSEPVPSGAWPLVVKGDTIAFARLAPLTQGEWRAQARELAQRYEIMLAALVMLLLSVAWLRRPTPRRWLTAVPLVATAIALAFSPLGAFGLSALFSPALFLLPLPADVPLGTLLAMLLAFAALAASVHGSERVPRMPTILLAVGALAVAIGYPGAIRLLFGPGAAAGGQSAATTDLLRGGAALWFGLQVAAVLLLGILTELALPRWNWKSPFQVTERIGSPWLLMLLGALGSSAALSLSVLLLGQTKTWVTPWFAAAWALPFLLAAFAIAAYRGGGVRLIRWLTAGWLAASAVLPFMWIAHVDARLNAAERDLSTLGATDDAFLEYRLMQFAREAKAGAQAGENGYHLLWRSWLRSRLAEESYPARLMLWSRTGVPEVSLQWASNESSEMPIGVPTYLEPAFARVRANPDSTELMRVQAVPDVNEALIVSPDSEQILTVEVAPRRSLEQPDLPFLGANTTNADTRVELVPARESTRPERTWVPSKDGWRSEKLVHFTDGDYHAHMEVHLPRMGVRMARGLLLLAFDIFLFTLLWLIGRAARGEHLAILSGFHDWRSSFRARVTATLFFFFLIPTAVFGWVAFGALSREVTRATTMVAERSVDQAVVEFNASAVAGAVDLRDLATRIDAQVLYYYRGELARSSSPEIRELGVYGAWMPPNVFLALTRGDEDAANATTRIGGHQVLTAYRALASGVLAVPMPLESGETAVRQAELRDMILFALLVGALLSLLLSVVVGRALTGPINRLARAAAAVGSGNLRVRMPEDTGDEFGQLYASFNRMVRRLRRARVQEVRTARVLAWGEMARQVAHEIKNPLTPIKLAVQHLRRAYADHRGNFNDILEKNVEQILLEIDRLSEIARAFSRYGAPSSSTGPLEPINIEQVVHEALTLYKAGDPDVEYREEVEIGVPRALGRSGELKEVLLNLLENARTALDGKRGVITVTARERDDEIELSVSDNGPGIPSDFLPRVFEPHFSTRSAGTGLGLAIVRRLVESWGGNVVAESEVGKGTTIRVVLQRA